MNNKIALKLTSYFSIALISFSIVIGTVFMILFNNYSFTLHENDLKERAGSIAQTLSGYLGQGEGKKEGMNGGHGAYIRFLSDIAGADAWVIDNAGKVITTGNGHDGKWNNYNTSELPKNAEDVIKEVLANETVVSKGFSEILLEPTLTVGAPIVSQQGEVQGAVLLHSPVNGTKMAINQGLTILLVSIGIALVVGFILSLWFSLKFTNPLTKMRNAATELAKGNYKKKINIKQNDEIGELAKTIDLLADELFEASEKSQKLEKMRKDFIANISHELRTPVTVMRGSLEAIVDKVVTDSVQIEEYHKQMLQESQFLQRLIGDLLETSKLQNPDFIIEKETIVMNDILHDIIRSATSIAQLKNIVIKANISDELCILEGDYGRLRQMILILLDNAIKFSEPNSSIEVSFEDNEITIKDYGQGIDEEDLPNLFERFYKTRDESNKIGTGLGLTIAKAIAERHDIRIEVTSQKNVGTTFKLKIEISQN